MKNIFPALFICLLFTFCKSQNHLTSTTKKTLALVKLEATRSFDISCDPNKKMTVYADSLNNLPEVAPLPSFLFNECFDLQKLCWPNLHEPISLRQIVVNKTTNKSVIERILKDDNPLLRSVCDYDELPIPEREKSWHELFSFRYAELK